MSQSSPEPIKIAEFLADHNAALAKHRTLHWWAPIEGMQLAEVLEYHAVRELLGDDAHMGGFLSGYFEDLMRQNPAILPEHIAAVAESGAKALINMDGPEHHRLRSLVSRNFTPRSVAQLRPFLDGLATGLAHELQPGADFMRGFARSLPARALCELTGIPAEDHERFIGWIDVLEVQGSPGDLLTLDRDGSERALRAHMDLRDYARALIAERRESPREDLVSRLVHDPEERASDETIVQLIADLIFAGNDTTRNQLGLMVMGLTHHPEIWESVAEDPAKAPAVVEEVLRKHSTAPGPIRRACTRFEYRDHTFEEGDVSALSIWSANLDEGFWGETACEFDAARPESGQHLSFGHGPHFCLGASLAREELRAALIALTSEITRVEVLEPPPMHPAGSIYGPISLHIGFERRNP